MINMYAPRDSGKQRMDFGDLHFLVERNTKKPILIITFTCLINAVQNQYCILRLPQVTTLFRLIKKSKSKWHNKIPEIWYGIFTQYLITTGGVYA